MKVLVTGAAGFVGKNLCCALKNIRDGKDRTRGALKIDEVFEYTRESGKDKLEAYCREADFVFNLAGVNRPKDKGEFMAGNFDFASSLLNALKEYGNSCPVMLSSSAQASLTGRYAGSEYGRSKLAGEKLFFDYAKESGARVLVYRFPNLFGKWCRPNYNSAVATFCHNIANGLPVSVNDPETELELAYIDDVTEELISALTGGEHRCDYRGDRAVPSDKGAYCFVPVTHKVKLRRITELLESFKAQPETLFMPSMPEGSFEKKLFSTFLSYLPPSSAAYSLKANTDARGSFTELLKTAGCGQFSVNVSKPGVTKGQHWHDSKWEIFIVVSGRALIRERKIGGEQVTEFEVSGDEPRAVYMLPGYTHSIVNLSESENLITLMWANEPFNPDKPDTFFEEV